MLVESMSCSPHEGRDSPLEGSSSVARERTGRVVLEKCVAEMERQASASPPRDVTCIAHYLS